MIFTVHWFVMWIMAARPFDTLHPFGLMYYCGRVLGRQPRLLSPTPGQLAAPCQMTGVVLSLLQVVVGVLIEILMINANVGVFDQHQRNEIITFDLYLDIVKM